MPQKNEMVWTPVFRNVMLFGKKSGSSKFYSTKRTRALSDKAANDAGVRDWKTTSITGKEIVFAVGLIILSSFQNLKMFA